MAIPSRPQLFFGEPAPRSASHTKMTKLTFELFPMFFYPLVSHSPRALMRFLDRSLSYHYKEAEKGEGCSARISASSILMERQLVVTVYLGITRWLIYGKACKFYKSWKLKFIIWSVRTFRNLRRELGRGSVVLSTGLRKTIFEALHGKISRCHRLAPGSIPGRCIIFKFIFAFLLSRCDNRIRFYLAPPEVTFLLHIDTRSRQERRQRPPNALTDYFNREIIKKSLKSHSTGGTTYQTITNQQPNSASQGSFPILLAVSTVVPRCYISNGLKRRTPFNACMYSFCLVEQAPVQPSEFQVSPSRLLIQDYFILTTTTISSCGICFIVKIIEMEAFTAPKKPASQPMVIRWKQKSFEVWQSVPQDVYKPTNARLADDKELQDCTRLHQTHSNQYLAGVDNLKVQRNGEHLEESHYIMDKMDGPTTMHTVTVMTGLHAAPQSQPKRYEESTNGRFMCRIVYIPKKVSQNLTNKMNELLGKIRDMHIGSYIDKGPEGQVPIDRKDDVRDDPPMQTQLLTSEKFFIETFSHPLGWRQNIGHHQLLLLEAKRFPQEVSQRYNAISLASLHEGRIPALGRFILIDGCNEFKLNDPTKLSS
ncbi:uncharacterized protein BDR25DRAFT_391917 [Lindgomyces ingoldianus]|uniref:Uncharacterized protein n=1 Tax=Lindgomyces ingoldianus TaxID=673940 RepID=A0ACB6R430_9PLEO|nr:uncharacterized protein BDR25DRAFT_391917 [Lindgomyces ingoldianus]KAF2474048.1 hypothetical protein BDR25DRAFT_391917 [Lindgomyces ingoldianus]